MTLFPGYMVDETGTSLVVHVLERGRFVVFVDVWAKGFWTLARAQDGRLFACGLNNFGQLGVLSPVVSGAGGNSSIISSSSGGRRGRSTSSAGGQSRQSSSSATTTTVQQMEPMEEEEGSVIYTYK
jgi:hypothetical protein